MITVFEIMTEGTKLLDDYTLHREPRIGSTLIDGDGRALEVRSMHSVPTALGESHIVLHVAPAQVRAAIEGSISHRSGLASKTDASDRKPSASGVTKRPRFLGEKLGR